MALDGIKQLIGDKALVKLLPMSTRTTGGILLPTIHVDNHLSQLAEVVELGDGRQHDTHDIIPWEIEVGQVVALSEWVNRPLEWRGEEYHMVYQHEVLAVIEGLEEDSLT